VVWAIFVDNSPDCTMATPRIIAHRGNTHHPHSHSHQHPPENTLAAFEQAIIQGADMVEFDVRCTQDQILIIHHNPKIAGHSIAQTPWPILQTLNPQIPTLAATLQHCQNRIQLDVEIKEIGDEQAIVELLLKYLATDDFVITSFNLKSLQTIKQQYPQVPIGLLLIPPWRNRKSKSATQKLTTQLTQLQPNFLAPHYKLLPTPWLQAINPSQIPYWVWTVNKIPLIQAMLNNSAIAAIITDNSESAIGLTQSTHQSQSTLLI
jgi:glycerophosphoryl diester phosphodiesterase